MKLKKNIYINLKKTQQLKEWESKLKYKISFILTEGWHWREKKINVVKR